MRLWGGHQWNLQGFGATGGNWDVDKRTLIQHKPGVHRGLRRRGVTRRGCDRREVDGALTMQAREVRQGDGIINTGIAIKQNGVHIQGLYQGEWG